MNYTPSKTVYMLNDNDVMTYSEQHNKRSPKRAKTDVICCTTKLSKCNCLIKTKYN